MTAGDMSGNLTSNSQGLIFMLSASIQAVWTGSPTGNLSIQISNDNINWSTYTGSSTAVSGAGNFMWNLLTTPYPWVRVIYTASGGTGSLNISVNGKGPS